MRRRMDFQQLERRTLLAGDVLAQSDVNQDGQIDHADAKHILQALESREAEEVSLYDVSGDGSVTALDALWIINHLDDQGTEPVATNLLAADGMPGISVLDAEVVEGDAGVTMLDFRVELSEQATAPISVQIAASDGSAAALQVRRIASGLSYPTFVTSPPGSPQQLMVMELDGLIEVLDLESNTVRRTPFLTVTDLESGREQGMLGLAFHPEYATNRRFFIYMTASNGDSLIREYQAYADGSAANPLTARSVLRFEQPYSNHNGGWIAFGPDGYLYIASGDGGSANDPPNSGQTMNTLLGKLLRIDVDGDDFPQDANRNYAIPDTNPFVGVSGEDEIWAYGLRNPWRNSFDRETGDLFIADVGQHEWEEINVQPASSSGGENYGWRLREGLIATPTVGGPKPGEAIDPIYAYEHGTGLDDGFSVTGGYVYRGPIRELRGNYFFADYVRSRIWSLRYNGDAPSEMNGSNFTDYTRWTTLLRPDVGTIRNISSFGEDAAGNLYILDYGGEIFRLEGGGDYLAMTQTLEFDPGEISKTFSVEILGDRLPEANEQIVVTVSNPVGATVLRANAVGTILNDDAPQTKDVVINRGEQQRSVVDEVTLRFDSEIEIDEADGPAFQIRTIDGQTNVNLSTSVSRADGETLVRFRFNAGPSVVERGTSTATLADGEYELFVVGSRISIGGVALDGDQDGAAGGDYRFADDFFRNYGDANANGVVDLLDFARFRSVFSTSRGDVAFDDSFDGNGDGSIGLLEFAQFRRNFGK